MQSMQHIKIKAILFLAYQFSISMWIPIDGPLPKL